MAALTTARRNKLPKSEFALPKQNGYPVDTANRARSALTRVSQFGSPAEKTKVRTKVAREYPGIEQSKGPQAKKTGNGRTGGRNGGNNGGNGRNGSATNNRLAGELSRRLAAKDRY